MTPAEEKYLTAIRAMSNAAYDALRSTSNPDALPWAVRQMLRRIVQMTDALVDAGLETAKDDEK